MKRVIFLLLICLLQSLHFLVAQQEGKITEGKVLLVKPIGEDGNHFLMPFIINCLREIGGKNRLFTKVFDLSRLNQVMIEDQEEIRILFNLLARNDNDPIGEGQEVASSAIETLESLNATGYFLNIKISPLQDLIEFQFDFFDRISERKNNEDKKYKYPVPDLSSPGRSVSVFINPKDKNYELDLKDAITKIFWEVNSPPIPKITVDGYSGKKGHKYFFAEGDTVKLSALESFDSDTPRERFLYTWRNLDSLDRVNPPPNRQLLFDQGNSTQQLVPENIGNYYLSLSVNDGISNSEHPAEIEIQVQRRPEIKLNGEPIVFVKREGLFDFNFSENSSEKLLSPYQKTFEIFTNMDMDSFSYYFRVNKVGDFYDSTLSWPDLLGLEVYLTKNSEIKNKYFITFRQKNLLPKIYDFGVVYQSPVEIFAIKDRLKSNIEEIKFSFWKRSPFNQTFQTRFNSIKVGNIEPNGYNEYILKSFIYLQGNKGVFISFPMEVSLRGDSKQVIQDSFGFQEFGFFYSFYPPIVEVVFCLPFSRHKTSFNLEEFSETSFSLVGLEGLVRFTLRKKITIDVGGHYFLSIPGENLFDIENKGVSLSLGFFL